MMAYLIRRILYAVPILIGVNLLTFLLFFMVNSPENMARAQLGGKHVTAEAVERWKQAHGYDLPMLYNAGAPGTAALTETVFYQKSARMLAFDFGVSDEGRSINEDIRTRAGPSLMLALPSFAIGLAVNILCALLLVLIRHSRLEIAALVGLIGLMSVSGLFYIISGQYVLAKLFNWAPISGYSDGLAAARFLVLPVLIGVVAGVGAGARWYRTLFLEEWGKEYVRAARAKGLSETEVLFRHVLKNAMIPILTGVVVVIPSLFLGSLIMESFFGIPGLGSYTIDGIRAQDFGIVRAMVYLGSVLYIVGLVLTDLAYTWVDPRVRLS